MEGPRPPGRGLPRQLAPTRVISALAPQFHECPPPPALLSPERGFPPVSPRGEGVLGCAGSVRALGEGQIIVVEARGQRPLPLVPPLGHLARQARRDSGTEKLCPIS